MLKKISLVVIFITLTIACGGNDCNDNDVTIHPKAVELCDNIDNNCDGLVDRIDLNGDGIGDVSCVTPPPASSP